MLQYNGSVWGWQAQWEADVRAPWKQHITPLKGMWQPKQVFFEGLQVKRERLADYSVVFDEDRLELKSPQFGHHKYRCHYKIQDEPEILIFMRKSS